MHDFWGTAYIENTIGEFSVGHWVTQADGNEVEPHGHSEAHIMFITGGKFVTGAAGQPIRNYPLMIYNPPGTYHADRFVSNSGSFFTISVKENLLRQFHEPRYPQIPTVISTPVPYSIVNKLMRESVQGDGSAGLLIESFCFELIGAIMGCPIEKGKPKWLERVFEILRDCYAQDLSLKNISREVGIHSIHLTRTFQAYYRCSPGEFLRARRLQRAAELLVSTDLSLAEIALESGFFDQSHLSRHFRRTFGRPPGEFRNSF